MNYIDDVNCVCVWGGSGYGIVVGKGRVWDQGQRSVGSKLRKSVFNTSYFFIEKQYIIIVDCERKITKLIYIFFNE